MHVLFDTNQPLSEFELNLTHKFIDFAFEPAGIDVFVEI